MTFGIWFISVIYTVCGNCDRATKALSRPGARNISDDALLPIHLDAQPNGQVFLSFAFSSAIQTLFLPGMNTMLHPFHAFEVCHLRAWKKMSLANFVAAQCGFLMMTG
jgi:hypothetical protein